MYTELTWLGVALMVLGLLVFAGPVVRLLLRNRHDRAIFEERRDEHRRRLGLDHEPS